MPTRNTLTARRMAAPLAVVATLTISVAAFASTAPPPGPLTYQIETGYFREVALGPAGSGPGIVSVDADDGVWVAVSRTGQLGRFQNGRLDLFDVGADSRPVGVVAGRDANGQRGAIWIAASFDNKLVRYDVASGRKQVFPIEGDASWPFNIALAPSGDVWFSQRASGRVGRLHPASGEIVQYDPPTAASGPAGLAVDPRSGEVWFTESYADRIARLDPTSGAIREYVMSEESSGMQRGPAGLAIDPQGGVWFAKLEGKLGHLRPGADSPEVFDLPPPVRRPAGIALAPDGAVWLAALDGNQLVRYDPASRHLAIYPIPTGDTDPEPAQPPAARTSRPFGIAVDSRGNVWFSEQYTGQLAVLDVAPPSLAVLSPGDAPVETASVLVTVRAEDRVAGVDRVEYRLNDRPVQLEQGRLSLLGLAAGPQHLAVRAVDHAGNERTVEREFVFQPTHLAILEVLRGLVPMASAGEARLHELVAAVQEMPHQPTPDLAALHRALDGGDHLFRRFPHRELDALIDEVGARNRHSVVVKILDAPPFFAPRQLDLAAGDTVRWSYDPPSDGHSISHLLHRIEIPAGSEPVRSPLLRAGEIFTYTFDRSGTFDVHDTEPDGGAASMRVEVR
jgi:streptogramin lyase/plastocyanin